MLQVIPSPDNKLLTLGLNKLIIWDLATGKEVRHYQSSQNWTGPVAVSPDGKTLALGGEDIRLQELVTGREIIRLNTAGRAKAMTFSPDGKWLVTNDGEIYAVPSGKIHRRIATMGLPPVAFSPDGRFFASAGTQIWDPVAGKLIHRIKDYSQESLLFTPDSKSLLLGQHEVRIYDTKTGKMRSNIKTSSTCPLALAPDGRLLAGAKDADVVLWNLASGEEVLRLKGHGARVLSVAFGLDGKTLFSGSGDTTCLVWDLPALDLPVGERPFAALPAEQALARLRIGEQKILVEALDHPAPEVRSQAVWKMAILAAKDGSATSSVLRDHFAADRLDALTLNERELVCAGCGVNEPDRGSCVKNLQVTFVVYLGADKDLIGITVYGHQDQFLLEIDLRQLLLTAIHLPELGPGILVGDMALLGGFLPKLDIHLSVPGFLRLDWFWFFLSPGQAEACRQRQTEDDCYRQ